MRRHLYGKYGFAAPAASEAPPAVPAKGAVDEPDDEAPPRAARRKGTR